MSPPEPEHDALARLWHVDEDSLDALGLLERLVAGRLAAEGVWTSPRTADGVASPRLVARDEQRVRWRGRIYQMEGPGGYEPLFWLDVERAGDGALRWTLYFGLLPTSNSPRRNRNAADLLVEPAEATWRMARSGITPPPA